MKDQRVECPVRIPSAKETGTYVNAFRVLHDHGSEWLLDFLLYSESVKSAVVVSRLRVQEEFLEAMKTRLEGTLDDISKTEGLAFIQPTGSLN